MKPDLVAYVQAVGQKVASRSERRRRATGFDIVDSGDVNAFSSPDGRVYVTRGLLTRMSSEDELAMALGREIAAIGRAPRDAREEEAAGLKAAMDAGYRPGGASDLLKTLVSVKAAEPARLEAWLASHPGSAERIAGADAEQHRLEDTMGSALARPLKRDPYLQKIEGIAVGWWSPRGYLKGARYFDIHRDYSIIVPPGWTIQSTDGALLIVRPDTGYRAEMTTVPNRRAGESGDVALDYARKAPQQGFDVTQQVGHARLPAGEAAVVTLGRRATAERGPIAIRKMFLARFDKVYVLTFEVPEQDADATMETFMKMTGSIKYLEPTELTVPPEPRLALYEAKSGDTWTSIAAAQSGAEARAAALATWNGRDESDPPAPGMLVKIPPAAAFD